MAVGAHGRTVVAWERLTNGRFSVEARIGDGPLRLGRTSLLARAGYRPQVADDADGTVAVEWAESGPRSGRDDEAFVASATPRDPVLLAMRAAGAASFAPPVALTSSGDGDVLLAAGGSHVLAAYQQADRLRLRVVP